MFQYYVSDDLICVTWYYRETFISMRLTCCSFKVGCEILELHELFAIAIDLFDISIWIISMITAFY